jgi:hypothetical protein
MKNVSRAVCAFVFAAAAGVGAGVLLSQTANAVPAFARQTGAACSGCHVGGFGPQLTAFGRSFKVGGYTLGDAPDRMPLSAMAIGSFSHTAADVPDFPHFSDNDNFSLDELSLFLAGRVVDHVGMFIQMTYNGVERIREFDNTDLRLSDDFTVGGVDVVAGISVNNNPGVQDPWNTMGVWGFPFTESPFMPTPAAGTQIDGALGSQVYGLTAYAMIDDLVYVEAGGYRSFSQSILKRMASDGGDRVDGFAPYWRVAVQKTFGSNYVEAGIFGMHAPLFPGFDRTFGTDKYTDYGFDATFQGQDGDNTFTINATYIYEDQDLDASVLSGAVGRASQSFSTVRINASYSIEQKYGFTVGVFDTNGTTDTVRYAPDPIEGSNNGSPNSSGYILQVDYTPWGSEYSNADSYRNLRVGLQYTGYMEFNGGTSNYDGFGRDASDNNTIQVFTWVSF